MGNGKGSSSSKRIRILSSSRTKKGRINVEQTFNPKGVRDYRAKAFTALQLKVACEFCSFPCNPAESSKMNGVAMNDEQRASYDAARDIPDDGYVTEHEPMDINDVLDGTAQLDISHAGGEFQHIMEEELHQQTQYAYSPIIFCVLLTLLFFG
jgi:hypothetical protein